MPKLDLGVKESERYGGFGDVPGGGKERKDKIVYPTLHIDNKDLGLNDDLVGKEVDANVKLKVRSIEKRKVEGKPVRYNCVFEVMTLDMGKNKSHYATQD